jgi:uncharacterized protein YdhG (YjbR/CyaY superfamily)
MKAATKGTVPKTVSEYIAAAPAATRKSLEKLRQTIKAAAPDAEESISYQMPGYKHHGMLVYFAGWKNHIALYPAGRLEAFEKELSGFERSKGTIKFPLDKPIPFGLISKIVKYRVKENEERIALKKGIKPVAAAKKSKKPSDEEQVNSYMAKLAPAVKNDINAVRKIIKAASPKLNERIKWNAPSYYYKDDILTFGPYKTHKLLLVFHHPAVVKVKSSLLEGEYKDRRLVYFKDKAGAEKNKKELTRIIREIVKIIDNK